MKKNAKNRFNKNFPGKKLFVVQHQLTLKATFLGTLHIDSYYTYSIGN